MKPRSAMFDPRQCVTFPIPAGVDVVHMRETRGRRVAQLEHNFNDDKDVWSSAVEFLLKKTVIIVSAIVGCRSCTIRILSAQLAQWAPPLERCALANPNPPAERDKVEITLARSGVLCKRVGEVRADCSQPVIRPGGCTHEQQEPRRLRVVQPRNPLE